MKIIDVTKEEFAKLEEALQPTHRFYGLEDELLKILFIDENLTIGFKRIV